MNRLLLPVLLTALAGCAATRPTVPVERSRAVEGAPQAAVDRAAAYLGAHGFQVQRTDPLALIASYGGGAPEAWANCPAVLVRDRSESEINRANWARPRARSANLSLDATQAQGGAVVNVNGRYEATYRNVYTNFAFEDRCTSAGALEAAVLDVAAGGA